MFQSGIVECIKQNCPKIEDCYGSQQKILPGHCCPQCLGSDNGFSIESDEGVKTEEVDDDSYQNHKTENIGTCAYDDRIYKVSIIIYYFLKQFFN